MVEEEVPSKKKSKPSPIDKTRKPNNIPSEMKDYNEGSFYLNDKIEEIELNERYMDNNYENFFFNVKW